MRFARGDSVVLHGGRGMADVDCGERVGVLR